MSEFAFLQLNECYTSNDFVYYATFITASNNVRESLEFGLSLFNLCHIVNYISIVIYKNRSWVHYNVRKNSVAKSIGEQTLWFLENHMWLF